MCYQAGANITTVMGLANPGTLEGALRSARRCGGRLLADMLNVTDLTAQAAHLHDMGVDLICVHNATDVLDMQRTVAEAQRVARPFRRNVWSLQEASTPIRWRSSSVSIPVP